MEDVINSESIVLITPWIFEFMHFLICDALGNMAIIEYKADNNGNKQRVIYRNKNFPKYLWALGNAPYLEHIAFMKQFKGFGGNIDVPMDKQIIKEDTRYQFAVSAEMLKNYNPDNENPEKYLLEIMSKVNQEGMTQVSIVYQPIKKTIIFNSSKHLKHRVINLKDFDFAQKISG